MSQLQGMVMYVSDNLLQYQNEIGKYQRVWQPRPEAEVPDDILYANRDPKVQQVN